MQKRDLALKNETIRSSEKRERGHGSRESDEIIGKYLFDKDSTDFREETR